jgi:integrase
MTKTINRLTDLKIRRATRPGLNADGAGLYLQVRGANARSWLYRFMLHGKAREMGLGSYPEVTLEEARTKAEDCRRLRQEGRDPIEARKAAQADAKLEDAKTVTFSECARLYIAAHAAGWRNAKHGAQWASTLKTYAEPTIGALPVQAVDTGHVLGILEPIWTTKTETASRVRGRIEAILDWAKVRGFRGGDNPARWRGHLDKLLPRRSKVKKVKHHPALHVDEIPAFMAKLRKLDTTAARALEFVILTAARSSEALGAQADEIAAHDKIWTVPENRIKGEKEHRVPLSARAIEVPRLVDRDKEAKFVFPGLRRGKPLSDAALRALLVRIGHDAITIHGFRSTFRDWAAERTNFSREVAEMALSHVVADKTEAAYRRGDLFEKRRKLMDAWAGYCASPPAANREKVVAFKGQKRA